MSCIDDIPLLRLVWTGRFFPPEELRTTAGQRVAVVDAGVNDTAANSADSTKVIGASVEIDGRLWRGAVALVTEERALCDADVILAVSFGERRCYYENGETTPTVVLPKERVEPVYNALRAGAATAQCGEYLSKLDPAVRLGLLNALLTERLEAKYADLTEIHRAAEHDWNRTLYTMIFRAMGGNRNKENFTRLAEVAPFLALSHERGSLLSLEALLLGSAGLLYNYGYDPYIGRLNAEFDLLRRKYNIQPMRASVWQSGGYPSGSPTLRIASLAAFFANREFILGRILECRRCDDLYPIFRVSASDLRTTHYNPERRSGQRPKTIGEEKAQSLGINLVVPIMFAYGKETGDEKLQERALSLLESIPCEKNSIVRRWQSRGFPIDNAFDSQAALQLNNRYCSPLRCAECRIGRKIISTAF